MARYGTSMIDIEDVLSDMELLKTHCIYSDEYADLTESQQFEIYRYCKTHATNPGCLASLEQIRYAITRKHFGF